MARNTDAYNRITPLPFCAVGDLRQMVQEQPLLLPSELIKYRGTIQIGDDAFRNVIGLSLEETNALVAKNLTVSDIGFGRHFAPQTNVEFARLPHRLLRGPRMYGRCLVLELLENPKWQDEISGRIRRHLTVKGCLATGNRRVEYIFPTVSPPVGFFGVEDAIQDMLLSYTFLKSYPHLANYTALPLAIVPLNRDKLRKAIVANQGVDARVSQNALWHLSKCDRPCLLYRLHVGVHRFSEIVSDHLYQLTPWQAILEEIAVVFPDAVDPVSVLTQRLNYLGESLLSVRRANQAPPFPGALRDFSVAVGIADFEPANPELLLDPYEIECNFQDMRERLQRLQMLY